MEILLSIVNRIDELLSDSTIKELIILTKQERQKIKGKRYIINKNRCQKIEHLLKLIILSHKHLQEDSFYLLYKKQIRILLELYKDIYYNKNEEVIKKMEEIMITELKKELKTKIKSNEVEIE